MSLGESASPRAVLTSLSLIAQGLLKACGIRTVRPYAVLEG